MSNVIELQRTCEITCPLCRQKQKMILSRANKLKYQTVDLWFPISPFCCDAMRILDTPEWNAALDTALSEVLEA